MTTSALDITGFALTVPGTDDALLVNGQRASTVQPPTHEFAQLEHGIWDLVPSDRRALLDTFAAQYAEVRAAEGRVASPAEIRLLPETSPDHPLAEMWSQRRASFERLLEVLEPLDADANPAAPARMVDIGAGCGWLSAHLARRGWRAAALDVTVDGGDGLAAARHHAEELLLIRGDMAALPFASGSVDLAVFNAALHYAHDIGAVLSEVRRVVAPAGKVVVLDSPVFHDPEAGRQMVAEFAASTSARLGVTAAEHQGPGFVSWEQVRTAGFTRRDGERVVVGAARRLLGRFRAGREVAQRPLLVWEAGGQTMEGDRP